MDIYEATQTLLQSAVPADVNVSAFVLTYDSEVGKFLLPDFPAVTYNYQGMTPVIAHDCSSSLYRVALDIEVWGDLEQIAKNAKLVSDAINAKRITVNNVEFTLVINDSRDIMELELDFKRRYMRFVGLVQVEEGHGEASL